jgi:uncharacterized caspase-like protein
MSPVGVGASRFASALETGVAKFWVLLIGVDRYHDSTLPSLRYAAVDCQGVGTALAAATGAFPDREFLIHHDLVTETPTLARVETSLHRIVTQAQPQDTVLIYFSGHGVVEPTTQQTVLCLQDTDRENLLTTGLQIQVVLEMLGHCAAHSQLLWLDACHSGNLNFIGTNHDLGESTRLNPIAQLLASLRHQAALSRGFYALLSCDEGQQSWEFPDLGHGVFSYYLMRGLQGEAADERGAIDADSLYRYVYRQTVQYIDLTNQQLRSADRQQRDRRGAEVSWCPEYSAQTPKRIVSGVGEIILGLKPQLNPVAVRSALIVAAGADRIGPISLMPMTAQNDGGDDLSDEQIAAEIGHALEREGKFTLDYFPAPASATAVGVDPAASLRQHIQSFLAAGGTHAPDLGSNPATATRLLYLRGQITASGGTDAWFVLEDGVKLSRAWLQQELQCANQSQQIIILDCPGGAAAAEWIDALKITDPHRSRCIIASAAEAEDADLFACVLLETLISAPPQLGMPIASLFTRLETNLDRLGIPCHFWLSDTPGSIEILPATVEPDLVALLPADAPDFLLPSADSTPDAPEITIGQEVTQFQPQTAIDPPISFTQNLESILYRLVGPIAPALLKAATATMSDADRDFTGLVHNLRPLLPERARAEFDRQVDILFASRPDRVETPPVINHPVGAERSATKLSRSAQPLPPDVITIDRGYFPPATRQAVEQTLKETIGPVAEVLLGQIAPTAWTNDRALLAALTPYLSASRLAEFAQRLQPLLDSPPATSVEAPPAAPENANGRGAAPLATSSRTAPEMSVDDNLKIACERELTQAIGPVAKFIIATTHKTNPHICPADFVNILATQIPDPIQAAAFRQKLQLR